MTEEQQRIVACWERHELAAGQYGMSAKRLTEIVSTETGADADTIVGALLADLKAGGKAS